MDRSNARTGKRFLHAVARVARMPSIKQRAPGRLEHGDISPTRFIEIAEDSGLIIDIGAWVANAACRYLRSWLDRDCAVPIAINVSAKELLYGDPARVVEEAAAAHGVPASLIEIEITGIGVLRNRVVEEA